MKRTISVLLALCLVLALLPFGALAAPEPGDATPIRNAADLDQIRLDLSGSYVLLNDIDLTEATAAGAGWISLGWSDAEADCEPFTGELDGGGHSIRGLRSVGESAGLFWRNSGEIRDLTIESGEVRCVSGGNILGAFCQVNTGEIDNCRNFADVTLVSDDIDVSVYCGGIAGWNTGTISRCANGAAILCENPIRYGYSYAGGIAGVTVSGTVERSWNTGAVSARNENSEDETPGYEAFAGGVVGGIRNGGAVRNAYNAGPVDALITETFKSFAYANAGGVVGDVNDGTVSNVYNRGAVTAVCLEEYCDEYAVAAGVIGCAGSACSTTNGFYLDDLSLGVGRYDHGDHTVSLSDSQMRLQSSFTGFDFDEIWVMGADDDPYPALRVPFICKHEETAITGAKPATCTEPGYTGDEVCTVCGETVAQGEAIPATGHSWGDWVVTTAPTATTEGVETRNCSACDAEETRAVPAQPENCDGGASCPSKAFTDVDRTAYYHLPMDWAVVNNVTTGVTPTTFCPSRSCTRAQMVTFLWRAKGSPNPTASTSQFVDVPAGQYYTKAVIWAVENEITTGVDSTHFMPNNTVTRAQTVTFLWRMEGKPNPTGSASFPDVPKSAYYAKAVAWAAETGVTTGTNGRFNPQNDCTRAQIVTFLYRAIVK